MKMALEPTPLGVAADHRYQCGCAAALNLSFGKPTVTFLTAVPVSSFVVDEHMRPGTLNW